jgi:hypothetical protein
MNPLVLYVSNNWRDPKVLLGMYILLRMIIGSYIIIILVCFIANIYFRDYVKNFLDAQLDHYGLKN